MPSSQFLALPDDQQDRILAAGLAEFAEHGYDLASTNRIVQQAGISKGVLFKYFTDKQALFLHVADVSGRTYFEGLPGGTAATDVFDWIREVTVYKLRFMQERPLTYRLWIRIAREPRHAVYARALETQAARASALRSDMGAWPRPHTLRPGVTWQHVLDLLGWISTGLQERFLGVIPEVADERLEGAYQSIVAEFDLYVDILRSGVYREGTPS